MNSLALRIVRVQLLLTSLRGERRSLVAIESTYEAREIPPSRRAATAPRPEKGRRRRIRRRSLRSKTIADQKPLLLLATPPQ